MRGHVYKRGKRWSYLFDIDPDPLTGKRRQGNGSGFHTEKEAWAACRKAIQDYETSRLVQPSKRTVEQALNEWLTQVRHAVKPSMWKNWRNYSDYYVIPHIGGRKVQDIDGAIVNALYARLLDDGRRRGDANARMYDHWSANRDITPRDLVKACDVTIHAARAAVHRFRAGRAPQHRSAGLSAKTVVNTHRMLHRAWTDFEAWKWVHRNVVKDAHPPRLAAYQPEGMERGRATDVPGTLPGRPFLRAVGPGSHDRFPALRTGWCAP
jgi:Arm DNA-binding domain/Phage integrase, N-terminal SAM-like domain